MITNVGKNIIAKYLIGDAPAYASYIAMGCGPTPRPVITSKAGVSTGTITGTILTTGSPAVNGEYISEVNSLASTAGLVVGMVLIKTAGTGAFGGTAKIKSIDTPTKITITSTAANTTGSLTFNTGVEASLMSTSNTEGLWIGAKVTILSGTGVLETNSDTLITAINSSTSFTISPGPSVNLSGAELLLEIDPNKKSLDFEMFRVPISSRGYVNDNGVNKIILTAQLPTEERYEISEIGVYSAGSNTLAGQYDSRTLSAFSDAEGWQFSLSNSLYSPAAASSVFPEVQNSIIDGLNFMTTLTPAIKVATTNGIFSNDVRALRYERPRYLGNAILLRGDTSYIYPDSHNLSISGVPGFLQISGQNIDLSKNSSSDLMKLAFSIISVDGNSSLVPDTARIIIEFSNTDGSQYARMQVEAKNSVHRFDINRYIVKESKLGDLFYTSGQFNWKNVSSVKTYVSTTNTLLVTDKAASGGEATITTSVAHKLNVGNYVYITGVDATFNGKYEVTAIPTDNTFKYVKAGTVTSQAVSPNGYVEVPTEGYYVSLDAIRVDNINTINPLYGLTGYSIIQNSEKTTIVKSSNTSNYIEYRFILDVT